MKTAATVCVVIMLGAGAAWAQETGQVGLAMGYPNAVGVIWHATGRIALVPRISLAHISTESRIDSELTINGVVVATTAITTDSDGWSVSPGIDVRVYTARWDNVATYLAPGLGYMRGTTTTVTSSSSPLLGNFSETREYRNSGYELRGTLGVQYTPHRRFGVYGEVGVRYARTKQRLGSEITSSITGNASAVGAVLYF